MARAPLLVLLALCSSSLSDAGGQQPASVVFENLSPEEVRISWLGSEGSKQVAQLKPSERHRERTYVGDAFMVVGLGARVTEQRVAVEGNGKVLIRLPRLKTAWEPLVSHQQQAEATAFCLKVLEAAQLVGGDPTALEEDAEVFCKRYPSRQHVYERQQVTEWPDAEIRKAWGRREAIIKSQPPNFKNFTIQGFNHLKKQKDWAGLLGAPFAAAFARLSKWYEASRQKAEPEAPGRYEGVISAYENDNWVVRPPEDLIKELVRNLQAALEAWAGLAAGSLERTAVYGVRLYRRNATLREHVDRWETHAISAILKVGERGIQKQWPLQILDHSGAMHKVFDKDGDVILYESATCAHGRWGPLPGREVANIFFHFRPKENWAPLNPDMIVTENIPGSKSKAAKAAKMKAPANAEL